MVAPPLGVGVGVRAALGFVETATLGVGAVVGDGDPLACGVVGVAPLQARARRPVKRAAASGLRRDERRRTAESYARLHPLPTVGGA